jgi:apolipoprotein N-acyltransferase
MLPESVAFGAVSLDGTVSLAKPRYAHTSLAAWQIQIREMLGEAPVLLILGQSTVEWGLDYNSLLAWSAEALIGRYHKRRLVPFGEYHPGGWEGWGLYSQSQYTPGLGTQLIRLGDQSIGAFICQEVLFPSLTRESVREGAQLLVSGGNDGVFGHPAVSQMHADAAQLRAVETGRYVIRAMKTGVSAIIDPYGRELVRSASGEPATLLADVHFRAQTTLFIRNRPWVLWLAAGAVLMALFWPAGTRQSR